MPGGLRRFRTLAVLCTLAGVVILAATGFLNWYTISDQVPPPAGNSTAGGATSATYFNISGVAFTYTGFGYVWSQSWSYSGAGFPNTGLLYGLVLMLVLFAMLVGAVGVALLVLQGEGRARLWSVLVLAIALGAAAAGPVLLAAYQPGALASDSYGAPTPFLAGPSYEVGTHPASTFWGEGCVVETAVGSCGEASWGPGVAWYSALAAGALFAIAIGSELKSTKFARTRPRSKS
jgi:hypothetical protein